MITVTVLVDDKALGNLISEHGLAMWIERSGHKLLFDTGQSNAVKKNAQVLGVNLQKTDAIVLSHGHYDHTGGFQAVLDNVYHVDVYLHPQAVNSKYACYNDKPSRYIGMPPLIAQNLNESNKVKNIIWTEKPMDINPGFTVTGPIPRLTDFEDVGGSFFLDVDGKRRDALVDDQALFFESGEGLVVVVGCAHSGIVNTLDYISQLTGKKQIHTVLGGIHLNSASSERITCTINAFGSYKVQQIGLNHCTGDNAVARFKEVFEDKCFSCSAGAQLEFREN